MKTETIYMNDKRQLVNRKVATMAVVRELDADGRLLRERWEYLQPKKGD